MTVVFRGKRTDNKESFLKIYFYTYKYFSSITLR